MKREWRRRPLVLLGLALLTNALIAGSQSFVLKQENWWQSNIYWPSFAAFLIPVLLAFALAEAANRFLLPGESGVFARKCVWAALALRLACLVVIPIAMLTWGYPSDENKEGLVALDAVNATQTAWEKGAKPTPLLSNWQQGRGDNTGGLTVIGATMFRLFSPDLKRSLLPGVFASAVTSLTVVAAFLLGGLFFGRKAADCAAVFVAIYPEAVLIGASLQQQGFLALLFAVELLAIARLMTQGGDAKQEFPLPGKRASILLLIGSLAGFFFVSTAFLLLAVVCGLILTVWLSDAKKRIGKVILGGAALGVVALVALRILNALDVVSGNEDILLRQYQFLFGLAWAEYDKLVAAGGGDMFQRIYTTLERPTAFLVAAGYGLVQPSLPAAIGYRNVAGGGGFWTAINILRGLGWYIALPLAAYGTLRSLGGILRRRVETILAFLFWGIAMISSYRAFGDMWDNPRYRLFALVPMALLVAWAWRKVRESRDPWFFRIAVPFAVAALGLTVWYFIRSAVPMAQSLVVILALTAASFIVMLFLPRRKKPAPPG
jgi:hypothetical protein